MGMYGYDSTPIDLEEEERQRQAAIEALAANGGVQDPSPPDVELPERVSPEVDDVGLPGDSGSLATPPPDPDQDGDTDPPGEPDLDPVRGLVSTPLQDVYDEHPAGAGANASDPTAGIIARAAGALADFNKSPDAPSLSPEPLPGEAPPRPGKGASDAERSPTAEEVPSKDGTPAPAKGQVQTQTPEEAQAATKTDPYDPIAALMQKGEEEKRNALKQLGERPGVNGWAIALSLLANRGRDLPNIIQQAESAGRAYDDDKRKMLLSGVAKGGGDPFAARRLDLQERGLNLEDARLKAGQTSGEQKAKAFEDDKAALLQTYVDAGVPESALKGLREAGSLAAFTKAKGIIDKEYQVANKDRLAGVKGAERAATEQAEIDTKHANLPTVAGDAGTVAGSVAAAQAAAGLPSAYAKADHESPQQKATRERLEAEADYRRDRDKTEDDRRAKEREADKAERTGDRKERQRIAQENKDMSWQTQFAKDEDFTIKMMGDIDALQDTLAASDAEQLDPEKKKRLKAGLGTENGGATANILRQGQSYLPDAALDSFMGEGQAEFNKQAMANRQVVASMADAMIHSASGKAFSKSEKEASDILAGAGPEASEKQVRIALDTLRTVVGRGIGLRSSPNPRASANAVRAAHLDPVRWQIGGATASSVAPTATTAPTVSGAGDEWDEYAEGAL